VQGALDPDDDGMPFDFYRRCLTDEQGGMGMMNPMMNPMMMVCEKKCQWWVTLTIREGSVGWV
jgi:hypothetical protein